MELPGLKPLSMPKEVVGSISELEFDRTISLGLVAQTSVGLSSATGPIFAGVEYPEGEGFSNTFSSLRCGSVEVSTTGWSTSSNVGKIISLKLGATMWGDEEDIVELWAKGNSVS